MDRFLELFKVIKEYSKDYVLENTGLKVLALLITSVIWLSVASRPVSRVTIRDVPVELRDLSISPKLTISKYDTLSANVFLTGSVDALDSIRTSEIIVYADFENVEPGVRVIPLQIDTSRLPSGVREQGIEPRSIRVTVEHEVVREVQVKPRFDGEPPEGFEIISQQIVPSSVRIQGAESFVRDITEVSTETVSLNDRREPFSLQVAIDITSPNVSISDKDQSKVQLTVNIGEVRREKVFDRVPVTLINASATAQAIPKFVRVTVFGARSAVEAMKPEDITIEVDASGDQARLEPRGRVSDEYANRVEIRAIEPELIRIK
jgi:YbbR domain-containing protein